MSSVKPRSRYNPSVLRIHRSAALFLIGWAFAGIAFSQSVTTTGHLLVVFPFANNSNAPGLQWIGEAFPELLGQRLSSPTLYVVPREDRMLAYDRAGIPAGVYPSRAALYRIAEQMDVDYVVLGDFNFDGRTFTAAAQLLDMRRERLLPGVHESGPLVELISIQTALAWDLLHALHPDLFLSRDAFLAGAPAIRLDAFENYVRGIISTTGPEKLRRFGEAVRISPAYSQALLQLGKAHFGERQYDQAVSWLGRVPLTDPAAREANFYLGLAAYSQGDFEKAEAAFGFVASRLPLAEVYNNLGVVVARRGKKSAIEYFQKAVDADPNDADYHFNLAVAQYRSGETASASRQLRETLSLRPTDTEAQSLLDAITADPSARAQHETTGSARGRVPLERIRRNYGESSFRQLVLKIDAVAEQRLAHADPRSHAQFHADRGHELLARGFTSEAEKDFREAVSLDASNAEAHAGLAGVLEANNESAGARSEAEAALRLRQLAEPLLVLARLDLRENRSEEAAENVERALRLEPSNAPALALKRAIAAKLAEKAQPLPNL